MKKETLKDWIKNWTIKDIVSNVFSQGMMFQATEKMTDEDVDKYKRIIVREIKSRIK
jgi:hypothetical protein